MTRPNDARPAAMLKQHARISSLRRFRYGALSEDLREWWAQIETIAVELGIATRWEDWQRWPVAP